MDLWPLSDSMVVITDIDLMDQVHVKRAFPQHRVSGDLMEGLVGRDNVASANGKTWKMLHNAMAPAFAPGHIKNLVTVMTEEGLTFRDRLAELAKTREVFSLEEESAKLIFDVIARIVFHFTLNAQTEGSEYLNDFRQLMDMMTESLSMNPLTKVKIFFKRQLIMRRLNASVKQQIVKRYDILQEEGVVPEKKNPYSILDLMLRDYVGPEESSGKGQAVKELSKEWMRLLLIKYAFIIS